MEDSVIQPSEDIFILHGAITKNIYDSTWHKFLGSMRKDTEFKRSGQSLNLFISNLVKTGELDLNKLNEFLFNELSFGIHKDVLVYKFSNDIFFSKQELELIMKEKFGKETCEYNELARTVFTKLEAEKKDDLASIKVEYQRDSNIVKSIKLIYARRVRYTTESIQKDISGIEKKVKIPHYENNYYPIDIDFEKKIIIAKSSYKTHLDLVDNKNINQCKKYVEKVVDNLEISLTSFQTIYQKSLYNMCKVLLEDIIKKKSEYEVNKINPIIDAYATETKDKLLELGVNIDELNESLSKSSKSTFDIKSQILNIIENLIITKILIEASNNNEGVEGLVSYIKFKDRSAVNAVLKTRKRKDSLMDSQSYLDLRKTLKECNFVEKLRVIWFRGKEELQLKYDTTKMFYLHIHFYEKLFKEELDYAIERVESFSTLEEVQPVDENKS